MSTSSQHIEDYALIGDLRTAALIARDGSIDWFAPGRFDSAAVFAALLGTEAHGHWTLAAAGKHRCTRRRYRSGTLILETDWTTGQGAVRVIDFMDPTAAEPHLYRIVAGLAGEVVMQTAFAPRTDYGRTRPTLSRLAGQFVASTDTESLWLDSDVALTVDDNTVPGQFAGTFVVAAGERFAFTLTSAPATAEPSRHVEVAPDPSERLEATVRYWTDWSSRSTYTGPWAREVSESLVLLKALIYAPTGSVLAAATTSLPEQIGGTRNWDYRYSWLRDASFTMQAFLAAGYVEEAVAWSDWLTDVVVADPDDVQIMYGLDGTRDLPEQTLDWLPGHAGSAPVRIGNAAATQQQNDVWGEVLDTLNTMRDAGAPAHPEEEKLGQILLGHLLSTWDDPDHGLWEIRGPRRHFVHSKLMAWVGVDRTVRTLERVNRPENASELARLRSLRATMRAAICARGYHQGRRAFTQSYGSARLDAAVLLMPAYGFLPWTDPRVIDTVDAIEQELTQDGLVLRYATHDHVANVDGVRGSEGVFLATSFWLADALHEMGRTAQASGLFERLLGLRNDVGLLSEEYDPATGHHLGNTPQAFSHAALVTTAVRLSRQAELAESGPVLIAETSAAR